MAKTKTSKAIAVPGPVNVMADGFWDDFVQGFFPDADEDQLSEIATLFLLFVKQLQDEWPDINKLSGDDGKLRISASWGINRENHPATLDLKFGYGVKFGRKIALDAQDPKEMKLALFDAPPEEESEDEDEPAQLEESNPIEVGGEQVQDPLELDPERGDDLGDEEEL